jgi:hypothetical protein
MLQEVSGKARRMAAVLDIDIDRLTHFACPVFIVAHKNGAMVGIQKLGVFVNVVKDRDVEGELLLLQPTPFRPAAKDCLARLRSGP